MSKKDPQEKKTRDISAVLARNIWVQLFSLVRQFGILKFLTPATYSYLQVVIQYASYSPLFQFGSIAAFYYRYPQWVGEEKHADCVSLQVFTRKICLIGFLIFIPVVFWVLNVQNDQGIHKLWLIVFSILAGFSLLSNFASASFNVRSEFRTLAKIDVIVAFSGIIILLAAVFSGRLTYLIGAMLVPPFIRTMMSLKFFLVKSPHQWSLKQNSEQFFYGVRVWGAQIVGKIATTSDIIIVAFWLGNSAPIVGFLGLSIRMSAFLSQYLLSLSTVHQQLLRLEIGRQKNQFNEVIRKKTFNFISIESALGAMGALGLYAVANFIVPNLFAAFSQSMSALGGVLLSVVVIRARKYSRDILNQSDRSFYCVVASSVQFILLIGGFYWVIHNREASLAVFGGVRFLAFFLAAVFELTIAYKVMGDIKQGPGIGIRSLLALSPALFVLLSSQVNSFSPLIRAGVAVAALPLTYWAYNLFLDGAGKKGIELLLSVIEKMASKRKNKKA